tara:strand:+ start:393 stop:902 length:510 start_codon:yes stop_codon:yes gene_type:complete
MNYEIKNKISKSPIKTIDLEDFIADINIVVFDLKNWLKDDLILIEKDFREKVSSFDWLSYNGKKVAIQCSNDAIIPHWAYMLVSSELKNLNIKNFIGTVNDYENFLITEKINNINLSIYQDKPVIIKGCSGKKFKEYQYSVLIEKIQPVAKRIMFGEACSSVPIFKRKK